MSATAELSGSDGSDRRAALQGQQRRILSGREPGVSRVQNATAGATPERSVRTETPATAGLFLPTQDRRPFMSRCEIKVLIWGQCHGRQKY